MKILGHGVDLVDIDEFEKWLEDPRDPLGLRCFTPSELAIVGEGPNRAESLAGRFAAKEAVLKALGIGFGDGAALTDVETANDEHRSPEVILRGGASAMAIQRGISKWLISISHEKRLAIASAIAVGE
jgi:holo-[acyl-carrier protein] synthase